jgi:transposase
MCINTKELLGITDNSIKILKIENIKKNNKTIKSIHIKKVSNFKKCLNCSSNNTIKKGFKSANVKHLKASNYCTAIVVHKRRIYCKDCKKTLTEKFEFIDNKKRISKELIKKVRVDLKDNVSFKYVGNQNNLSTTYVRNSFNKGVNYRKYEIYFPEIISFDEFKADTDKGKYSCIINDPINKKTIDILPTRKKVDIIKYLKKVKNKDKVKYVISDMWEPYLQITKSYFKNALYVVDRFHYVRYIMTAIDTIRINLQKEYNNEYYKYTYRLLKGRKNVSLLRKYSKDIKNWQEIVTYTNFHGKKWNCTLEQKLDEILDIDPSLQQGYFLKEKFLDIVHTASYEDSAILLTEWIKECNASNNEPFIEAAKTIENWLPYIVNSFIDKRYSNGYTEGLNNKIKAHKRVAYGYQKFDTFRNRLLYIIDKNIKG